MLRLPKLVIVFLLISSTSIANAETPLNQDNFFDSIITGGDFELTANIDASEHGSPFHFSGTLDGKNFKIYNLSVPLFDELGNVGEESEIINLRLEGDVIEGNGILANSAINTTISDVHVRANTLNESTPNIGGLVGLSDDVTIDNSSSTVNVSSTHDYAGGLVGQAINTIINNSYATGDVTSTGSHVGGLIGFTENGEVTNSYATGDVNLLGDTGGGLIGGTFNTIIENSHANGNVDAGYNAGGLIGYAAGGEITSAYATGNVISNQNNVGGLIGEASQIDISHSFAMGDVSSTAEVDVGVGYIGGLIGMLIETNIVNSYATGNATGDGDPIGRLVADSPENLHDSNIIDELSYGTGILDRLEEVEGGREIHYYYGPPAPQILSVLNASTPSTYSQDSCINNSLPYLTSLSSTYSNSCTSQGLFLPYSFINYEILTHSLELVPKDLELFNFKPNKFIHYPSDSEIKKIYLLKVDVGSYSSIKLPALATIQLQIENLKYDDIQVWLQFNDNDSEIFIDLKTTGLSSIILPTLQLMDEGSYSFQFTSNSSGSGEKVRLGGVRVFSN